MDEQNIFLQALEQPAGEIRDKWLDQACGGDPALRARIDALLKRDAEAGSFLEKSPSAFEATIVQSAGHKDLTASMEAGFAATFGQDETVILGEAGHSVLKSLGKSIDVPRVALRDPKEEGPEPITQPRSPQIPQKDSDSRYQLQGEIARGGMGAIIKGRDTDLGRDLAIKVLLDSHKDKPEVIQRFVEEAQIGGQLQHPGIAPVYELGQFSDQRPFFSMKLVKGETLSKLLGDRKDAAEERGKFIGIFEQICQTIAYAHSRGVIHRDLKPANIMVGAFGEVQVMDWGLAKVLSAGGVADEKKAQDKQKDVSLIQTLRSGVGSDAPAVGSVGSAGSHTLMGSVMGTPAYMPPEQALGEIDRLDQRADVFGLGAILCEILTGKPPYVGENGTQVYRMASRGKLNDAFQRLDGCGADAELVTLAKDCLSIELAERPKDAGVLAERVTAYLETVEQKLRETELAKVDAQVRAEELRRRNKLAISAGMTIVATLLIGITVSVGQAVRATKAERQARTETTRATQAERLAIDEAARATAAEKKAAETLVQVAAERDKTEEARKEAVDISQFLTDILQSPDPTRDGREIKVVELLEGAAKKLETELADQPAQRANLQSTLGSTYLALGLYPEAILVQEQVRDYRVATSGLEDPYTLIAMEHLGFSYRLVGRGDEALKLHEQVLELRRKVLGEEHPETLVAMQSLGNTYEFTDRKNEALELREQVLTLSNKVNGPEHRHTLTAMQNLANSYIESGRLDEALKLQEEALPLTRKELGPEAPDTLKAMHNLANAYHQSGRLDEAIRMAEEVLTLRRKVIGEEHPDTLTAILMLGVWHGEARRLDESLKLLEQVLPLNRKVLGPEHPETLQAMLRLGDLYIMAGRLDESISLSAEVLAFFRKKLGPENPQTLGMIKAMAAKYVMVGRQRDATTLWAELSVAQPQDISVALRAAVLQKWFEMDADYHATRQRMLAWATDTENSEGPEDVAVLASLCPVEDPEQLANALAVAKRGVELGKNNKSLLPATLLALGMVEYRNGQFEQAAVTLATAADTASDSDNETRRAQIDGTAKFYRAMCLFHQGKTDEARALFNTTQEKMKALPSDDQNPLSPNTNFGDLISWLAYKEAKDLLAVPNAPE